jgi:hypothetical protein
MANQAPPAGSVPVSWIATTFGCRSSASLAASREKRWSAAGSLVVTSLTARTTSSSAWRPR